jgi:hypothetical protein
LDSQFSPHTPPKTAKGPMMSIGISTMAGTDTFLRVQSDIGALKRAQVQTRRNYLVIAH